MTVHGDATLIRSQEPPSDVTGRGAGPFEEASVGEERRSQARMCRPKDPQRSLLETSTLPPAEKLERLKDSWAWQFGIRALPLIDEEAFREFYCPDNGAPSKPVQTVVGVLLLPFGELRAP